MDTSVVNNREAIEGFVDEALDSLRDLPALLDSYRSNPADHEPIHAVFRAIHSIKGCAAFLDLDGIRNFSHSLENSLDAIRNGQAVLSEEINRELITGFDLLEGMLQEAVEGQVVTELRQGEQELLDRIRDLISSASVVKSPEELLCEELLTLVECVSDESPAETTGWGNRLRELVENYASQSLAPSESPSSGSVALLPADLTTVRWICDGIDITDRVKPIVEVLRAYENLTHDEQMGATLLNSIRSLAAWATDTNQHKLAKPLVAAASDLQTILDSPIELDAGLLSVVWDHLGSELAKLRVNVTDTPQPTGSQDDASRKSPPDEPEEKNAAKSRFVRVKENHLDEFMEHVSRLFITVELFKDVQSRIAETGQLPDLANEIRQINTDLQIESTALQQSIMALRRVAISGLFSKFPRMARTLASKLGKKISVHLSGEETEIDKTLAEDLDAPLTHLIRNVVDHGIEQPEQRSARGVNEAGNLWLTARQLKSHTQITVQDDGRGIDPDRLRAKAVEKGILSQTQAEALSDQEAIHLIFHPGFSTAENVSEVSGRGVGMDVVRTTVAQHGGEIHVESQVGVGTTFRLDIPIRQATLVIDGLMVCENDEQFVVPFENIREIITVTPDQLYSTHGRRMIKIREQVHSAARLSDLLGLSSFNSEQKEKIPGILVYAKEEALCLMVDRLLGHRQVVVSSLGDSLANVDKMAGVAQLGGGRLALVLNVVEIIKGLR